MRTPLPSKRPETAFNTLAISEKRFSLLLIAGSQVGAAVIILASHQWDPRSILGSYVGCDWLISTWLRAFFSGPYGFPPAPQNSIFTAPESHDFCSRIYAETLNFYVIKSFYTSIEHVDITPFIWYMQIKAVRVFMKITALLCLYS